jgi:CheY-like chemotaxis protein
MLRRLIGEDIELVSNLAEDLGTVTADPGQIEQVLLNLAVNSRDAMPQGGRITFETANVILDADHAAAHSSTQPGGYVLLTVSDTGCGMDSTTKARIFEPFFTTKAPGKGTGLGLATVYGIVKQSGGYIWVYSELGHGTAFKIYFPRTDAVTPTTHATAAEPGTICGTETILLVEDQDEVRTFMRTVLESHGYHVLAACNSMEAERIAGEREGMVQLLLTDVVLPRRSGPELAKHILEKYPNTRVLFMSGYSDEFVSRGTAAKANITLLEKPISEKKLLSAVRDALAENQTSQEQK